MVDKVLKFLLLVSPISYLSGMPLKQFDISLFYVGIVTLFCASLLDTPKREFPDTIVIPSLFIVCLINICFHRFNIIVISTTINLLLGVMGLCIVVRYANFTNKYYKFINIAVSLNIIVWIVQRFGWNPILTVMISESPEIYGGIMGNVPRLAALLCVTLAFQPLWLLVLSLIVCWLTGQMAIFAIAGFILLIRHKNIQVRIGIIAGFLITLAIFHSKILCSIITIRFEIWQRVFTAFFTQPMAGYGFGVFPWKDLTIGVDKNIFSSLLQFISGLGILAVIWLGFMFKKIGNRFNDSRESLAVLSILLLSLIEYPFEIERLWTLIIAIIGFWLIHKEAVCQE